ncbi:MAG: aromatic amino acid DMT transporter YddG, partial [Duodenibacillus sp.]|nr:aromatic amino acid DMT transporter YddG [Duodenibacillus sp.]
MLDARARATLIGMAGPVCWGTSVGLVRTLSELCGPALGVSVMSAMAAVILGRVCGVPRLSAFRPRYLILGVGAAAACEFFFALSLAISDGGRQTLEVGMVNYLWPCLTLAAAIVFNGQKARPWVVLGLAVAFAGIMTVMSGDGGLDLAAMAARMRSNPLSYLLALAGAVCWALYCSATRAWAGGLNPVALIYAINAAVFGVLYAAGFGPRVALTWQGAGVALVAAVVMGSAYAAWTHGVLKGSMTALAIASYFTPVLSCLFGAVLLSAEL